MTTKFLLGHTPNAKLIPRLYWRATFPIDFQKLFTPDGTIFLVGQMGNDSASLHVDHITRGRISELAVVAKGDPAWLVSTPYTRQLFRRHYGCVKDMQLLVMGIADPDFLLIGRQPNSMRGTAMPFDFALLETLNFHTVQLFARCYVSYFET
jgi:hypothetical protein